MRNLFKIQLIFINKALNFKLLTILVLIIVGFTNCDKNVTDFHQPAFTNDQLSWVNNLKNPIYKIVSKSEDTTLIRIDTVVSQSSIEIFHLRENSYDNSSLYYDEGHYSFSVYKSVTAPPYIIGTSFNIDISNRYGFDLTLNYLHYYNATFSQDTATINGKFYNDLYNLTFACIGFKKVYFRKGIGFVYIERSQGSTYTMLY